MFDSDRIDTDPNSEKGRVLALDLGERRIGVAVSDESRLLARSLTTINRTSRLADFEKIQRIVDDLEIVLIVIGLPLLADGTEGSRALWIRDYATEMNEQLDVKTVLVDESYSTLAAESSLRSRGVKGQKQRAKVDAAAAAFILQDFLDGSLSALNL